MIASLSTDRTEDNAIIDAVQALMRDFPDSYRAEQDEHHRFPQEFYSAFATAGLLDAAIPEAYGGSGLGITDAGAILREVAASGAISRGGDIVAAIDRARGPMAA